ncbi:MAG: hypothetical protein ACI9TH_001497 [Kiritimatiellia bacterium]|jgi:uncharacterized protein involved in response to NO
MNLDLEQSLRASQPVPPRLAPFGLGFRPFFLGAAAWAVLDILLWLAIYRGMKIGSLYYDPITWHAHEMIFGFTVAVIAGFLLTAVTNWTSHPGIRAWPLAGLFILWLAGRIVPLCAAWLPPIVIAGIDLAFIPALAFSLIPAIRKGKPINWIFPCMLLGLTAANVAVHFQVLGYTVVSARTGLYAAIYLVLLLIQVIAGRVFPFFTEKAIPGAKPWRNPWINGVALGSYIAFVLVDLFIHHQGLITILALCTGLAHAIRLSGWFVRGVLTRPILWILYAAYTWIILGFLLKAGVSTFHFSPYAALHAWTAGGIGVVCIGMMTRVSRGHTGRPMTVGKLGLVSFICINLAALLRVAGTLVISDFYVWAITISAVLWALAYALFLSGHAQMLLYSRPDGKPG